MPQEVTNLTLRPYQQEALDLMAGGQRPCEFDDMGLGKSVISLKHVERYMVSSDRVLIIAPVNALYVWQQEIQKWMGNTNFNGSVIYWGTPKQRNELMGKLAQPDKRYAVTFVICTSGNFTELLNLPWKFVICDEIHRWGLLNHKTKAYGQLTKYQRYARAEQILLLTGTPIRQGCIDLYAPLSIGQPTLHRNYWHFVNKWCVVNETPFGKQIDRRPADLNAFRTMWRSYAVRRLTDEVRTELPEKSRNVIPIAMSNKQAKAHKDLMKELTHLSRDEQGREESLTVAQNKLVAGLKARQLLVSPRLLGIDEDGAGLEYLKAVVPDYIYAEKPVVIFTPFIQAVEIIADVFNGLCNEGRTWTGPLSIYKLHGQMTPAQFGDNWMAFQGERTFRGDGGITASLESKLHGTAVRNGVDSTANKRKLLICTVKSGAAFHATEAATCFFLGCDWDFNHNEQCEKRLHRLGQINAVEANYLLYEGDTVDQNIRERLNDKNRVAEWILSSEEAYAKLLAKTRYGSSVVGG